MKPFWKYFFASVLGTFVTFLIIFLIFFGFIVSTISVATTKPEVKVKDNTVLKFKIDRDIIDRKSTNPFLSFNWSEMKPASHYGLNELLLNLKKAQHDPKIKGILLEISMAPLGMGITEELRNALYEFKSSGKFIVSYGNIYPQKAYYLASVADQVWLHPEGNVELKGLMVDAVFLKNMLEKLDIEAQIIRHGKYKSAVEPFMLDKMSPENRQQTFQYTNTIWQNIASQIAASRSISLQRLDEITDSLLAINPQKALHSNLVDRLVYQDEIEKLIGLKFNTDTTSKINYMNITDYFNAPDPIKRNIDRSKRIAVIYALGEVVDTKGYEQTIGTKNIPEAIRKAREDDKVKAVVLRVNSPGGSALTSDIIWREIELTKAIKPVVASFGDVAASGGYYIACNANKIIASPNTITGSIGVFGVIPNAQKFFNNRLGLTFDEVKTNDNADFAGINRPLTSYQKQVILQEIEKVYSTFVSHVANGRDMAASIVDSLGQGRVWSGVDAKKIGFIDEFGDLQYAINVAAQLAKIQNYKVVEYPEAKAPLTQFMEAFENARLQKNLKNQLGPYFRYFLTWQNLSKIKGPIARLPYDIYFE
ncbi:MAG TPA: signal peptide peptidase SppA [Bacteroidales bacterium]|nr:signal peptide peptidase SppA [Bacteroidales bacterium]